MPKTFYTERDIDDLLRQGVKSLIVDDDVVLTDLAYEKARKLGLELLRADDQPPAAPVRPYIAKLPSPSASGTAKATVSASRVHLHFLPLLVDMQQAPMTYTSVSTRQPSPVWAIRSIQNSWM